MKEGNPSFEPYEGEEPYIFVSYSHKDKEVIDDLEKLSKLRFRIWYDAGILTGAKWGASIDKHLNACSVFMIFISDNAVQSDYVLEEVGTAKEKGFPIVPIFLSKNADPGIEYRTMLKRQGIEKWNKSLDDYYFNLYKKLQEVASHTREDPIDRDSKMLGISYLPTMKDVICYQEKPLTPEIQEERRIRKINDMRNANSLITSYHIDNIFQITSEVTQALHNLGEMEMEQFKFNSERPTNMLTLPLDIGKVYVAPLRLVTGLITRLDENWPPLVASYKMLVKQSQMNRLDDLHYYIEFCWLAWGPSVLTTSLLEQDNKFMVVQAAFGDEANSIPLIMKKAKWELIEEKLIKRDYGWPVSLKNVLVVRPGADDFFEVIRSEDLFRDIFSDPMQVALYLPHEDKSPQKEKEYADGEITVTDAQEACYSTAYVWLMLEQISRDEIHSEGISQNPMEPGKVIPFFEHANLGTSKGLEFLQHCLARKAIYHVLECENEPGYREMGYYTFATALFPVEMIKILDNEISRLNEKDKEILKKRFRIPKDSKHWRTPLEVVKFADAVGEAVEDCCKILIQKSGECETCDKRQYCKQYIGEPV